MHILRLVKSNYFYILFKICTTLKARGNSWVRTGEMQSFVLDERNQLQNRIWRRSWFINLIPGRALIDVLSYRFILKPQHSGVHLQQWTPSNAESETLFRCEFHPRDTNQ